MIPLKLTVRNFMCYRDDVPPLDLDGVHVACLCGDNGHGKSALLDAMTWALWGEARARTQEELIHQGRSDMAVELDFKAREQTYRVSRKYSRTARGSQSTLLELQVLTDDGGRPITGNTVRDTEARIRDLLNMDYDTFVNTAFLLQGRADEFTRSTPARRKECLAEVLDLAYYRRLEERARERSRNASGRLREIEGAIAHMRAQVDGRPASEERLTEIEATLARLLPEVEQRRSAVELLRSEIEEQRRRWSDVQALEQRMESGRSEVDELGRQIGDHQTRIERHEAVQQRQAEIVERYARIEEVRAETARLDEAASRAHALAQERTRLQGAIAVRRERLSVELSQIEQAISADLEPKAQALSRLEETLRAVRTEQEALSGPEAALAALREEAQALGGRAQYVDQRSTELVAEMEETRKKFDMLDRGEPVCPLCKQPLGDEGQEHLALEYRTQGQQARVEYQQHKDEAKRLEREHSHKLAAVSAEESGLERRRREIQTRIAASERDLKDSKNAVEALAETGSRRDRLRARIDDGDFANDERRHLEAVEREAAAVDYDGERHGRLREEMAALDPYVDLARRLAEAAEALPRERESLDRVLGMRDRRRSELADNERRRNDLSIALKPLPALETRLSEAQAGLSALERELQKALVNRGVVEGELKRLNALERELRARERERHELQQSKGIFDELAVAFGRNGIQALIIETAIPDLQNDANELLGRLTDGRMTLKLQLREGRKERLTGTPSEELDIRIGDEVGTRAYEMFSGGEAFRINFALRIALSRLLAQRSGAPLPILFIDEGFGTQDMAGQERLREAIQSIQSDFQKIIVITHLEGIKESFPTRIEVTKTAGGSTFQVV